MNHVEEGNDGNAADLKALMIRNGYTMKVPIIEKYHIGSFKKFRLNYLGESSCNTYESVRLSNDYTFQVAHHIDEFYVKNGFNVKSVGDAGRSRLISARRRY